ncbi:MAG TPA: 30S ribosomal protein S4 [Verrucomicrobiae bacterium]|nr:30S ribosomal protein S4 [Verrucomicrobiae bacterium]
MARYTGPRSKVSRRFSMPIFGPSKSLDRKAYPPGQHGQRGRRKLSEYALALAEKQKLRFIYGVMERQFRRYFREAIAKRGVTGDILMQMLETRLDNVVFRLGLATSRRMARQMVNHGHILVNGRRVSIASFGVREGQVIEVADKARARQMATKNLEASKMNPVPDWLTVDAAGFKGTVARTPTREDMQPVVNEQLVVELYSRRV